MTQDMVISPLSVSRTWLRYIRESGIGKHEMIFIRDSCIPYYLRIEPYKMSDAFGGKVGYKVEFYSVCCLGTNFFGNISSMMHWLNYMFRIVSVP
jgi:hypothetical protein